MNKNIQNSNELLEIEMLGEQYLKSKDYKEKKKINKQQEKYRISLINRYNKNNIKHMKLDDYVQGKGNKDSFCYIIERKLTELGSIKGSPASKFGVYYNKKEDSYKVTKKFGENVEQAFTNIKNSIERLVNLDVNKNETEINKIKISEMFKHKTYYLYNPEEIIPIFSIEHLNYFLTYLGIKHKVDESSIKKRKYLYKYKKMSSIFNKMSNVEFMQFLYSKYGILTSYENSRTIKEEMLSKDIKIEVVDIDELKPLLREEKSSKKGKSNYEEINKNKSLLGEIGEEIALKHEKDSNKKYAKKIKRVSLEDDSLGYDIFSYDEMGKEKHIEVKTKSDGSKNNISFYLTLNELDKFNKDENYIIYYVYEARTRNPKIIKLTRNHIKDEFLEPVLYKVNAKAI